MLPDYPDVSGGENNSVFSALRKMAKPVFAKQLMHPDCPCKWKPVGAMVRH